MENNSQQPTSQVSKPQPQTAFYGQSRQQGIWQTSDNNAVTKQKQPLGIALLLVIFFIIIGALYAFDFLMSFNQAISLMVFGMPFGIVKVAADIVLVIFCVKSLILLFQRKEKAIKASIATLRTYLVVFIVRIVVDVLQAIFAVSLFSSLHAAQDVFYIGVANVGIRLIICLAIFIPLSLFIKKSQGIRNVLVNR